MSKLPSIFRLGWAFVIVIVFLCIFFDLYRFSTETRLENARLVNSTRGLSESIRRSILNRASIAESLAGIIKENTVQIDENNFEAIVSSISRNIDFIRSVQFAPEGKISFITNSASNSEIIGLDLLTDPNNSPYALLSLQRKTTVLQGPIDLIQGGRGLIVRTPIFDFDNNFLGFVSVVLDIDEMVSNILGDLATDDYSVNIFLTDAVSLSVVKIYGEEITPNGNEFKEELIIYDSIFLVSLHPLSIPVFTPLYSLFSFLFAFLYFIYYKNLNLERIRLENEMYLATKTIEESNQKLIHQNNQTNLALENSQICFWRMNIQTGRIYLDERWKLISNDPEAILITRAQHLLDRVPDGANELRKISLKIFKGELSEYVSTHSYLNSKNEKIWIRGRGKVIEKDSAGKPILMIGTNTNITKEIEYSLKIEKLLKIEQVCLDIAEIDTSNLEIEKIIESIAKILIHAFNKDFGIIIPDSKNISFYDELLLIRIASKYSEIKNALDLNNAVNWNLLSYSLTNETDPFYIDNASNNTYTFFLSGINVFANEPSLNPMAINSLVLFPNLIDDSNYHLLLGDYSSNPKNHSKPELADLKNIQSQIKLTIEKAIIAKEKSNAKQVAEDALETKTNFLAGISHEIRTPLNGILGILEIIKNQSDKADIKSKADIGIKASIKLSSLLDDMLDLQKIDRGLSIIKPVPTNFKLFVENCFSQIEYSAKDTDTNIDLRYNSKIKNENILIDDLKLSRIISNLASNAIKFSSKQDYSGKVIVTVEAKPASDNNVSIDINISDNGIGIKESEINDIFEPWKQANTSILSTFGGTGLGLYITKNLIEMLGGSIKVESELGKGTTFFINLTARQCSAESTEPSIAETPNIQRLLDGLPLNLNILIVDDDEINRKVYESHLTNFQINHHTVSDGKEALECLKNENFSLIITDIYMPNMDGISLLHRIRSQKSSYNQIPVIASTASKELIGELQRLYKFNAYLPKPITSADLLNTIFNVINDMTDSPKLEIDKNNTTKLDEFDSSKISIDETEIINYLGNDKDLILQLVETLCSQLKDVEVSLVKFTAENDTDAKKILFHSLKSSSKTLGLSTFSDLCKELESLVDNAEYDIVNSYAEMFSLNSKIAYQVLSDYGKALSES